MSAHLLPRFRLATALLWAAACLAGFSPPAEALRLTGQMAFQASDGSGEMWFNCEGENPCRGTYVALLRTPACPDEAGRVDTIAITGLDLSRAGPISGSVVVSAIQGPGFQRNPDGTCAPVGGTLSDFSTTFTGTWNGSQAQLVFPATGGVSVTGSASVVSRLARVTGTMSGTGAGGAFLQAAYSCEGENPCMGNFSFTQREEGCSNTYTLADALGIFGMNLSQPGPLSGGMVVRRSSYNTHRNPDGTCTFTTDPSRDGGEFVTGSWDGSSGTLSMPIDNYTISGPFTASFTTIATIPPPPVFEMTVTTNITPTVSSARADIRFRPQDVGTSGSVYAFAVAPQTLVRTAKGEAPFVVGKSRGTKAGEAPVACVLAQLDGSGQMQAVSSASGLQAYATNVLSSQGQAVQVLDSVATANIAGSTFYVGYGPDTNAMINGGINRSVVTVPGTQVCQPQPPQTGWWWNPAEGGRGYTIESSGHKLFIAAYLYDVSGRSTWYISAGSASLDGSLYVGDLESYSGGQTLTGPFKPPGSPPAIAGQVTLAFSDATHGTLVWPGGTVPISRYEFGTGGVNAVPQANQPENGWWWNADESGRGFFIEWQAGVSFTAAFMYETDGHPVWYIAASPRKDDARVLTSSWEQYANGQTLTGPYKPATQTNPNVGAVRVDFSGPSTGLLTLPDGRTVSLSRYRF